MNSIDNVLESLRDMRSAEKFHKLFECISVVAELLQVTLIKLRTAMRSIYRAAAGGADVSAEDYYRISVYYPTMDNIVTDVELRFGPVQKKAATLVCLVPGFMKIGTTDDDEWEHVQDAVNAYCDLLPDPVTVRASIDFGITSGKPLTLLTVLRLFFLHWTTVQLIRMFRYCFSC